ncbi:MAG: TIGR04222 domain-containing membrane protein, partial [Gemmataceae bacterium]|nr:TIGR04222 domain-containing membrane protein [Gemmataceae bacterium]
WVWFVLRVGRHLRRPVPDSRPWPEADPLDWPDIAFLSGGRQRVFQAATVWLVQNQVLGYDAPNRRLVVKQSLPAGASEAAAEVYALVAKGGQESIDAVREVAGGSEERLVARQLCFPSDRRGMMVTFGVLQFALCMLPGGVPFAAAGLLLAVCPQLSRGQSGLVLAVPAMGPLSAVLLFSFWQMCWLTSRRNTALGDRVLAREEKRVWPARPLLFPFHAPPDHLKGDLALLVAAFGDVMLSRSELAYLLPGLSDPNAGGE